MPFFVASAVKKWPNFSKLIMKWPIWQPWNSSILVETATLLVEFGLNLDSSHNRACFVTMNKQHHPSIGMRLVKMFVVYLFFKIQKSALFEVAR